MLIEVFTSAAKQVLRIYVYLLLLSINTTN